MAYHDRRSPYNSSKHERPIELPKFNKDRCKGGYHSWEGLYMRKTWTVEDEDAKKKGAYWTPTKQKNKWIRIGQFCPRCHMVDLDIKEEFTKDQLKEREKLPFTIYE